MNIVHEKLAVIKGSMEGDQIDIETSHEKIPSKYGGTAADKRDMAVLGKKQELRVCIDENEIFF
jgi:hypothetical protein